jgi:signal transduction histidine kinase
MAAVLPTSHEQVASGLVIPESTGRLWARVQATSTAAGVVPGDLVIAAVVALASLVSLWLRTPILAEAADSPGAHPAPELVASVQIVLTCAVLAWRRRAPGTVLAATVVLTVATYLEQYPMLALPYPVLVAVYTVAELWPRRTALAALASTLIVMNAGLVLFVEGGPDDDLLTESMAILAVWALGRGVRLRQGQSALLTERAHLLEEHARHLADEQSTLAQLAVERERAKIARELHDIVANNIGVIVAWVASRRRRPDPMDEDLLVAIERLGRETLHDIRGLVGVLHADEGIDTPRNPPRLDRLPILVSHFVAAGTQATLEVTGTPRELPAGVELNAYRVVQESLTNAMKHAQGSRVEVLVGYHDRMLHLRVRDFGGAGTTPVRPGSGLFGMRQRVTLLGGSLRAGPVRGEPGFEVDAVIPFVPAV